MSEEIRQDRRHFLGTAAMSIAAAEFAVVGSANAQSATTAREVSVTKPGSQTSFGPLKQIDAGVLNIGYVEVAGPAGGPPVILLHGWPYDIYSFVDVAPLLAAAGYRVLVPYVRGYGTTSFLSADTFRNGQPSAVALDTIVFMDALNIRKATLAGFDWGARSANIVAALWPERCKAMVSVSGYLIGSPEAGKAPLPPQAELQWWYQFYFATERGRAGYDPYRRDFLPSSFGSSLLPSGRSTTRPSTAAPRPSTTRITSRSPSTTTAGDSPSRRANGSTKSTKSDAL